jgi:tartrate-resistant acid phosphatase type 5
MMKSGRTRWYAPSAIAVSLVVAGVFVATKGTGCGGVGRDGGAKAPGDPRSSGSLPADEPYEPRDLDASVVFAVIGDYGVDSANALRVARLVAGWNPDFIVTTGDNNYPSGGADTIDANIGKRYARYIGNYKGTYGAGSETNRFWPAPGNHDWLAEGLRPYLDYFTLPGNERYYDVARGLVHLFAVDSAPNEPDGITSDSVQARWLQSKLAASRACFKVVYFHHPAYSSSSVHGSTLAMRWSFAAWGADAVLAGHDHVYERLDVDGIPYLTVGLGGASLYGFAESLPGSTTRFNGDFGAVRVTVDRSSMTFDFVDAGGHTIDSDTRHKDCVVRTEVRTPP